MSTNNKITNSSYDVYSKIIAIAQHHAGDLEGGTDFLKSGFGGAITEQMAMVLRDSAMHKSMLYNESFLNTAVIPKSIYNWAKMFNVDVSMATPSKTSITLTMSKDELDAMITKKQGQNLTQYGSDVTGLGVGNVFIIDRGNEFIVDDYSFSLERSIMITENGGAYNVKYITTESTSTNFLDNTNVYLKYITRAVDGVNYISIDIDVVQYTKLTTKKQITSAAFTETKVHKYAFTDQLCGMNMTFVRNNMTTEIELNSSDISTNNNCAVYTMLNTNEIQIKFQNGKFIPSSGGALTMNMYLTKGASGNINFTGDVAYSMKDEDYRTLSISAKFTDYVAYGGVDAPSLSDIKTTIVNEISNRDVIVTESDLNRYFASLKSLFEDLNSGQISFVKKRSDIIKRVFNTYILMREANDWNNSTPSTNYLPKIIPTNTVDVQFPVTSNMSKPFGSLVKQTIDTTTAQIKYKYVPDELVDPSSDDYFVIPFYMRINVSPFKKVKYIYNLTDDSTTMRVLNLNNPSRVIVPGNVSIFRGFTSAGISDTYTLKFTVTSDEPFRSKEGIYLTLYRTLASPIDVLVPSSEIEIISESYDSGLYENTIVIPLYISESEFDFENLNDFGTYINVSVEENGDTTYQIPEDTYFGIKLTNYNVDTSIITLDARSDTTLNVFTNLDNIMSSDITFNTTEVEEDGETVTKLTSIDIAEIPVVHSSFFDNGDDAINTFIKQMISYISILKSNMSKLETNTTFNIKFMNTYGSSLKYDTSSTNIKLELTIYLYHENTEIESEIRDYIRVLVDRSNVEGSLKVSKINALVSSAYSDYVSYIEINGLNGTFNQFIDGIDTSAIVPEHFNLDTDSLEDCIKFKVVD